MRLRLLQRPFGMKSPMRHHYDHEETVRRLMQLQADDDARFQGKQPRMPDEQRRMLDSIVAGAAGQLRFERQMEVF